MAKRKEHDGTPEMALTVEPREHGAGGAANALDIIRQAATDDRVDPEKLRALLSVKREWEQDEARKTFSAALSEFQRRAPIIEKGDMAHNKAYARMDRIWRAVRPIMDECGLSVSWQSCLLSDGRVCQVRGTLRHQDGHAEAIAYDLPLPELIKGQNVAQQMGSAVTYAKRYALCSALNIVTGDDDDDGNAAGAERLPQPVAVKLRDFAESLGLEDRMLRWAGVDRFEDFPANKYEEAMRTLEAHQRKHANVETDEDLP